MFIKLNESKKNKTASLNDTQKRITNDAFFYTC